MEKELDADCADYAEGQNVGSSTLRLRPEGRREGGEGNSPGAPGSENWRLTASCSLGILLINGGLQKSQVGLLCLAVCTDFIIIGRREEL